MSVLVRRVIVPFMVLVAAGAGGCVPSAPSPSPAGSRLAPASVAPSSARTPDARPSASATGVAVRKVPDLVYSTIDVNGKRIDLALDLYLGGTGPALPLLVFVHGGGWIEGSKADCPGEQLGRHGFAVACIDYRLAREGCFPWASFPGAVIDVRTAVEWLREHAADHALDAKRIALMGDSSGAHLAVLTGLSAGVYGLTSPATTYAWPVQAIVDWYGPTDIIAAGPAFLEDPCDTTLDALVGKHGEDIYETWAWGLFLGGGFEDDDILRRARLAAPATHADAGDPPVLVIHGRADDVVSDSQSELLVNRLEDVGADVTFVRPTALEHSFWKQTGPEGVLAPEVLDPTLEFLRAHLLP